jgi:hypothetical protein
MANPFQAPDFGEDETLLLEEAEDAEGPAWAGPRGPGRLSLHE